MITILGTSHISKRSSQEVREAMQHSDIVALELDAGRVQGLLQHKQATFKELRQALGLKAAVMASVMRSLQEKLAKDVNVLPGVEMRTALQAAIEQQKPIVLIDRDIGVTLKRLSKAFGWREIWQLVKDLRPRRIPVHPGDDLVLQLLTELKERYPRIYTVMVSERDKHMAELLVRLQHEQQDKSILVIVGKAHVPGMTQQINYINRHVPVAVWSSPGKKYARS